ncbi:MAG: TIGR02217 family protein [Brevundimonas sp.]|uniref:phage distal tail protein, Rcc01695 family n=1 Tax=Brevundimonas sp. TaxID=1871086 RepID=UPI00391B29CC
MMAFHEVRLPARLAFGSTGGVERRTEIVTLGSGFERRSTPWAQGRRRYLIGANLRSLDDMAALTAFFEARQGRLYGFRFRDFADFKSCAPSEAITPLDQDLGVGDGARTRFELGKRYGADEAAPERRIHKPVDGTVVIAVDGVQADPAAFEIELTTGVVTFAAPPGAGAVVTAGFEFDVPVRFDADRIDVTLESFAAGRMAAVPLIEVRV